MRQKEWVKGSSRQLLSFVAEEILRDREGELFFFRCKHDHGVEAVDQQGARQMTRFSDKIYKENT